MDRLDRERSKAGSRSPRREKLDLCLPLHRKNRSRASANVLADVRVIMGIKTGKGRNLIITGVSI
jgi:hypothetical protein